MRTDVAVLGLACLALAAVTCGGNVVVDGAAAGPAGGSTSTGGVPPGCSNLSGEAFQGGGCQTDAVCNGRKILIQCAPDQAGATCTCTVSGSTTGTCEEPGPLP